MSRTADVRHHGRRHYRRQHCLSPHAGGATSAAAGCRTRHDLRTCRHAAEYGRDSPAVQCAVQYRLARYGVEFYSHFDTRLAGAWGVPQAHFHQRGYLVLLHATNQSALQRRYALQRQLGVEVEMLSPAGVRELVPSLCTDEIVGGIYGWRDGYLDPRGALQGFVERSRELGATWVQDEVTGFTPHTEPGGDG